MINHIIEFSARNRGLIVILTICLTVFGVWSLRSIPLDAIPDLSDPQVIIYTEWPGRSPDLIEAQITYPIVSAMLAAPHVSTVRGSSDYGFSYVYVIFDEGTDIYWGRTRVLEYMSKITGQLPEGVSPKLGPDATGVGWAFQYALVDKTGQNNLQQMRSFNDWYLRYWLSSVPGVAEVATIGGFVKQYQVNVDPNRLLAYKVPLTQVMDAVRNGNNEVGARSLEMTGKEYLIRGRGYIQSLADIQNLAVAVDNGTPVRVRDIARVELVTTYDRSDLIDRSIDTLRHTLIEELIIVSVVILIFLWHIPSAIIPILTIPISVVLAFIPMYFMGLTTNIMSITGIAISIGVLVDGAIVEVENAYKRLEQWIAGGRQGDFHAVRLRALKEVGPSVFFSLLVIAIAFMPIFTLVDQEGRLFKPLAYTKNLAMAIAACLAITLDPAMRMLFTRMDYARFRPRWVAWLVNTASVGRYYPEERHPISKRLFRVYEPVCNFVLRHKALTIGGALLLVLTTIPVYLQLGSEFMPPLDEGTILYMPTTTPGLSVTEAQDLLQKMDRGLYAFPEVERVFGKAGRAETSTDPAPFSMMEVTIVLKPHDQWRKVRCWYSDWPEWTHGLLRHIWSDRMTTPQLIAEMDQVMQFPGVVNAWTMPVKARIDMLSTGVRTPVGIKILGSKL